jgi:hypothetical protein
MKSRSPLPAGIMPLVISAAIVFCSGCIHITHPSNVRPGWSADIVGGVSHERYRADAACGTCAVDEPTTGDINVVQMNLAWGKRLQGNRALRTGLMIPLSMNNGGALGAAGGTTLDLFFQFLKGRIDMGVGGMAGLVTSGVYVEGGKTFSLSRALEMNIDMGASAEIALLQEPGIRPFVLVGLSGERWKAGLWADYLEYADYLKRCDENCEADDFLERSVSGGLFVGASF